MASYRGGYRDPTPGGLLNASWPLYRWDGIEVRVHFLLLLFTGITVLSLAAQGRPLDALTLAGLVFVAVLLHEYGHCYAARAAGGSAREIVMGPLGGMAFVDPPPRPMAHFWTTAAGPAVNLLFCFLLFPLLATRQQAVLPLLNPFDPFPAYVFDPGVMGFLGKVYRVNYLIFFFNAFVPIFPLDGGRMLHALLWRRQGHDRALLNTATVGVGAAAVLGVLALAAGEVLWFVILVLAGVQCLYLRRILAMQAAADGGFYDLSAAYERFDDDRPTATRARRQAGRAGRPPARPGLLERYRLWRQLRAAQSAEELEAAADRLLDKVHAHGLASLTKAEKRILQQASEATKRRRAGR